MSDSTAPLPSMASMFPDMAAPAPDFSSPAAAPAAPAGKPSGKTAVYSLPDGVKITTVRPTNRVRRVLVEDPAQQVKFMLDTIAANCITEMTFPADYDGNDEDGKTLVFDPKDIRASHYSRLDDLSLVDTQAFSAAFEERNSPTKTMVEDIIKAINEAKAAKK